MRNEEIKKIIIGNGFRGFSDKTVQCIRHCKTVTGGSRLVILHTKICKIADFLLNCTTSNMKIN